MNCCNKTFACCKDLHNNEERFGGTLPSMGLFPSSGEIYCSFKFADNNCKARYPTDSELRLWQLLYDSRAKIVTLNNKIEETRELLDYDSK